MSINKEGNGYTLIFAIIMVVVVGGLLAYIASSLKPIQQENVKNEKMQNILQSIGIEETKSVTRDEAGAIFNDYITERFVLDYNGNVIAGSEKTNQDPIKDKDMLDAFNVDVRKYYNNLTGLMKKYPKGGAEYEAGLKEKGITYPMFVCEKDGETYYITYFSGKGLWDDIWGYISLREDGRTINGTVFDHKGETPGLGSKITEPVFNQDFVGKVITTEEGVYRPIKVIKPGNERKEYEVAGLSGATFTAVGVDEMMKRSLSVYSKYFKNNLNTDKVPALIDTVIDSTMNSDSTYLDSMAQVAIDENAIVANN